MEATMTWHDREVTHEVEPTFNGIWHTVCGIGTVLDSQVRDGVVPTCLFCVVRRRRGGR
jgi:hypothetical protein